MEEIYGYVQTLCGGVNRPSRAFTGIRWPLSKTPPYFRRFIFRSTKASGIRHGADEEPGSGFALFQDWFGFAG